MVHRKKEMLVPGVRNFGSSTTPTPPKIVVAPIICVIENLCDKIMDVS